MEKNKECCGEEMGNMPMGMMPLCAKRLIAISLAVMMLTFAYSAFIVASSYSRSSEPTTYRSFSVSSEGKVTAIPDIAQFSFSVITEGAKDMGKIQKENTEKMNKAIDFVKSKGVLPKDIKTSNYNLSPRYQYFDCTRVVGTAKVCPPPEIVGYTINQTVSVKIRDFSTIGDIVSGIVTYGVNDVSQLSFGIDDQTMVEAGARADAIAKAKVKAKMVAKAGGFEIGRLIAIEEGNNYSYAPRVMYSKMDMMAESAGSAPAPQIEAGSQDVSVNVTLRYEIE
ncbi:MAG: SIMPL domain-containing protein [bacterium]